MQNQPLISVLIPTYNRAQYIRESIDSVLAQDYDNLEIIVVDDGSTDNTREVVERYGKTVKYFYKENGGISSARNTCLKHASGEYIAWCDSDDYWLQGKLQAQLKYFQEHPDCDIVFTRYANFFDSIELKEELKNNPIVQEQLCIKSRSRLTSSLVKREVFEKAGDFCEELAIGEDIDIYFRLDLLGFDLKHCLSDVYEMRRFHKNNISWSQVWSAKQIFNNYVLPNLRKKIQTTYNHNR